MEPKTVLYLKIIQDTTMITVRLSKIFYVVQLRLLYTISNTFVSQ